MKIPRRYIEEYSNRLNWVSGRARSELESALAQVDYSAPTADVRDAVITIMQQMCGASSTVAARIAADFYDGLRTRFGIDDGFAAEVADTFDPGGVDGAVRALVDIVDEGGPVERFVRGCSDRIDYEVRRSANECIAHNAKRDPRKPRWARVPIGACTCDWCIMLASRGFAYHTEDAASHSHPSCDCRCLPSWDAKGGAVEGYDVEYYKDCYEHPDDHPEIREAQNARRRELYAESAAARRAETKNKKSVPDAAALETFEGKVVRDSGKLQRAFKPETAAMLGVAVEDSLTSGDAARMNAAKVFCSTVEGEAAYKRVKMAGDPKEQRLYYNPARRRVDVPLTQDVLARTVVHETLHLADYQQRITFGQYGLTTSTHRWNTASYTDGSGYIKAHLADDWRAIEDAASSKGVTVRRYLQEKIEDANLYYESYDDCGFVSDMIDAASNGDVYFSASHTAKTPTYWTDHGGDMIGTECLANYAGSAVCNPVEYRLMRELFPNACRAMDGLLEVMANA